MNWRESTTATICATLPRAVHAVTELLQPENYQDGDIVVEIGAGPGPFPQAILRQTRADIRYVVVELNPRFAELLRDIPDDRLMVINESAVHLKQIMEERGIKARDVLSSMPFSSNESLTTTILKQTKSSVLQENGRVTIWNFRERSLELVEEVFGKEHCIRSSAISIPPIKVIHAKQSSL